MTHKSSARQLTWFAVGTMFGLGLANYGLNHGGKVNPEWEQCCILALVMSLALLLVGYSVSNVFDPKPSNK